MNLFPYEEKYNMLVKLYNATSHILYFIMDEINKENSQLIIPTIMFVIVIKENIKSKK